MVSSPSDEVKTKDNGQQSCCCPHQFNPCFRWSSFCSWYVQLLERFFGWFGERIAKHPLATISICLVFVSICSVGFVWFQSENRTVKLFIPQSSQAIDELNTAEKYFRVKFREQIILLAASSNHPNVLAPRCLLQAFKVHHAVMGLESYSNLCVTLSGDEAESKEECMMINPLEFLQFNKSNLNGKNLTQVQEEINKAYNDTSTLMRNGRPFWYNFNHMFGKVNRKYGSITEAKALQMVYLIRDPADEGANEKVLEWEKSFIDKAGSLVNTLSCFEVHYVSERSLDDAISESSGSDITLVSITFTLMIIFTCIMLGKFLNPLTGHSLLATAGVFAVALGILSGFGLAMWCRIPFVSIVGVLPFLVLGIGIDDMFILVDELDRQPREMSKTEIIKAVMAHSGATVTMTTLTDLVAFAVSTSSLFPAVRYFCIYAALTVTFSFFMIITLFVAIMTYDVKRIKSGRRDCLPLCLAPQPKEGKPAWDLPLPQMSNRVIKVWGKFLTHPVTKVAVIGLSLALLAAGIYGVMNIDETFDRNLLAKDNSYLKRFISAQEKHFELSLEVSIVENGSVDYETNVTQEAIKKLTNIVTNNEHYRTRCLSWMDAFSQFGKSQNMNITGATFLPRLKAFLSVPQFSYFTQDLKFSKDGNKLEASRILGFTKSSHSSTFHKKAMLTLREDLAEKSRLDAFPITRHFIFFEQYTITTRETLRNLIISGLAVLVVTSPFLVDCTVTFLVVVNFAALICELFGLMVVWNVSLNSVSMFILVMAIGFAVDYSAHIAHAFVASNKMSANERVVDALSTLGASVFMGSFSTFLGIIVLAFAASEIFRIFFRMFFGIVVFGLLHGLCILPVYLSLLFWRPAVIRPSSIRVIPETLSNGQENDKTTKHLQLVHVGIENPGYVTDESSFQWCKLKLKRETDDGETSQKDDETAGDVVVIDIELEELQTRKKNLHEKTANNKPRVSLASQRIAKRITKNQLLQPLKPAVAAIENKESVPTPEDLGANHSAEALSPLSPHTATNGSENTAHAPYDTDVKGSGDVTQAANNNEERHSTHDATEKDLVKTTSCPSNPSNITKF